MNLALLTYRSRAWSPQELVLQSLRLRDPLRPPAGFRRPPQGGPSSSKPLRRGGGAASQSPCCHSAQ